VPSFRRRASVIDADRVDEPPQDPDRSAEAAEALALAEEAEAEAAEAEAAAVAARARARAIRLRRQAQVVAGHTTDEVKSVAAYVEPEVATTNGVDVETETTDAEAADVAESEDSIEDEAEEQAHDEPIRNRRRRGLARILKVVAAAVAIAGTCALITLSVLMVIDHRHQAAEQQRRAEFAAAARQSVVTLMSLDFNKAKDDVQRIIDNSTGQFRDDFKNQMDDFVKVAQDSKVVTEVTVNATAVESMTNDSADVLVSATSRVTNAAGAKQEPRSWRLSVHIERDGGQLKMSKVEFVP
jgi:Mce-associated membrane protein